MSSQDVALGLLLAFGWCLFIVAWAVDAVLKRRGR